jgi:glycosyltransferase involved in cell wall biosynthesis
MRILYCEHLKTGGLSTWSIHVYEVVTNLSKLGHQVVLLNAHPPEYGEKIDIRQRSCCQRLKNILFKSKICRPFAGIITIVGLFLIEIRIFTSALLILVRQKGRFDVIYRRHNLFGTIFILARLFKIPLVKEINGIYADEVKSKKRGDRFSLWCIDKIEHFSMSRGDHFITVTSKLKSLLQDKYGIPEIKITVNPNGANIDLFKPMDTLEAKKELGLNPDYHYICFIGNLVKWLGIEYLVKCIPAVAAELPDTRCLIVGDGDLREEITNQANTLGIADKVVFTGMVPYQQVPLYINAADVCVMPAASDSRNGRMGASPLKLHEYMACARPVVAGNVAGDIDELTTSGSGLVVDSTNTGEMAGAFITLLKNEPMRKVMGERARKIVVEKYSWSKNAEQVAEVCQSVARQYALRKESQHK